METDDEEEEVEEDETLVEKVSISNQDLEEAGSSKGMQGGTSSATEGEVDLTRNTRKERQPRSLTKDRYQELVLYNLSLNQSGLILLEVCSFNIELGNIVYLSVKEYIRRKKIAPKGIYCFVWLGQG